jgi:hypothetical protein
LGIIDNCLTHQTGIPLSKLYHRQLKKMVYENIGIHLRFAISREWSLEYAERLSKLLNKTKIDGVLLQLSKMHFQKAGIVVHYFEDEMLYSYIHPFLFRRRKFGWKKVVKTKFNNTIELGKRKISKAIINPLELPPQGSRIAGFRLRDLNYIIGSLVKLDTWAVKDELKMVTQFTQACQKNNIPVFITGPTPYPTSFWRNRICRKINTALDAKLSCMGVPFSSYDDLTDQQGNLLTTGDGIHSNLHGHNFLARFLSDALCPWIKKIVPQTP